MSKLIITSGLPGCGKSTWAKQAVLDRDNTVRVGNDDLRNMLFNDAVPGPNEKKMLALQRYAVEAFLRDGFDVILDNTHLTLKSQLKCQAMAYRCSAGFEIKTFYNISVEECIKRDLERDEGYVGENIILMMVNNYERSFGKYPGGR